MKISIWNKGTLWLNPSIISKAVTIEVSNAVNFPYSKYYECLVTKLIYRPNNPLKPMEEFYKYFWITLRSSHSKCFVKAVLKNFVIFVGKHLRWILFLKKLQTFGLQATDLKLYKSEYFPVNIPKFLRTLILKNICRRLLLDSKIPLLSLLVPDNELLPDFEEKKKICIVFLSQQCTTAVDYSAVLERLTFETEKRLSSFLFKNLGRCQDYWIIKPK